jgi:hypothetical protein
VSGETAADLNLGELGLSSGRARGVPPKSGGFKAASSPDLFEQKAVDTSKA